MWFRAFLVRGRSCLWKSCICGIYKICPIPYHRSWPSLHTHAQIVPADLWLIAQWLLISFKGWANRKWRVVLVCRFGWVLVLPIRALMVGLFTLLSMGFVIKETIYCSEFIFTLNIDKFMNLIVLNTRCKINIILTINRPMKHQNFMDNLTD